MKCSRYNVVSEVEEYETSLLFNTFTGALIEAESDVGVLLRTHAASETVPTLELEAVGSERVQMLKDNGFLVEESLDEVGRVRDLDRRRFSMFPDMHSEKLLLTILPSIRCNFDCFYCFEPRALRQQSTSMTIEVQDKILTYVEQELSKDNIKGLSTTWYGGEPLLFPQIVDRMQAGMNAIAERTGSSSSSSIVTNGYCLTREASDMLVRNGIDQAQITLDGPEPIHNKRRLYRDAPEENYRTIAKNILASNPELMINIRVNVGNHNKDVLTDLIDDLSGRGIWPHRPRTSVYLAPVTGGKDSMPRAEYSELEASFRVYLVEKYNELSEKQNAKLEFQLPAMNAPVQCSSITDEEYTWTIDRAGDVYRCWDVPGQPKHRAGTIDDLLQGGIESLEAWTMDEATREETGCYQCRMAPVCMVACPTHFYQEEERPEGVYAGKHDDGNPFCSSWRFGIEDTLSQQYSFYRRRPEWVYNFPPKQEEPEPAASDPGLVQIDSLEGAAAG